MWFQTLLIFWVSRPTWKRLMASRWSWCVSFTHLQPPRSLGTEMTSPFEHSRCGHWHTFLMITLLFKIKFPLIRVILPHCGVKATMVWWVGSPFFFLWPSILENARHWTGQSCCFRDHTWGCRVESVLQGLAGSTFWRWTDSQQPRTRERTSAELQTKRATPLSLSKS